ncbi:HNH endonuclease signature motif containing protein [Nocardioides zeae]|uniref:HNH endonuclease signature motif containing protein n=1 Tax=Nocardioides imazamoxiresistens TaxID=3231893 RepID=A0ABU3PY90_9ACTN|nr:HNH endonuclease signature motif containing protein [Nocardioides zeae]MDT9593871.1 HNH endonuclease signature motif containing protein [Nocardioides zeae]
MSAPVAPPRTPADVLDVARAARAAADAAEVRILECALEWAYAHPAPPDPASKQTVVGPTAYAEPHVDPRLSPEEADEATGWHGIPAVRWDAPAAFAAACRLTTRAGGLLLRDALLLAHRLPLTWARVRTGDVPAWRARRVAGCVAGQPDDVAAYLDEHVHAVAHQVGLRTLDRLLDEALLRLHAEDRELEQLAALDAQHVTLHSETLNHTGIAEMTVRGQWTDLAAFDAAVQQVAQRLADPEVAALVGLEAEARGASLQVRRALAVGVLADPEAARSVLSPTEATARAAAGPRKRIVLHLHLTDLAVMGLDPVGRMAAGGGSGQPALAEQMRAWCARTDAHVTVRPVLDVRERLTTDQYEVPDRLHRHLLATHTVCAFPWCERPAEGCDADHIVAWQEPPPNGPPDRHGGTSTENLAPLCRHHHRLKTHTAWRYLRVETGTYLWTDPHGLRYIVTPRGTCVVDRSPGSPDPGDVLERGRPLPGPDDADHVDAHVPRVHAVGAHPA